LGVTPIAIDDGFACLLSAMTLDERHEAESYSVGAGLGDSLIYESIDLGEQAVVHPCN
jgi:hypothetical protein